MSLMFMVHLQWAEYTCAFAQTHIVVPFCAMRCQHRHCSTWTMGQQLSPADWGFQPRSTITAQDFALDFTSSLPPQ